MKNGTAYGKRIRFLFDKLRAETDKTAPPESTEPVPQLLRSILSVDSTPNHADKALTSLSDVMVDINEVRVSSAEEIAAHFKEFIPDALPCAVRCHDALNDIFRKTNGLTLNSLMGLGRREARQFLDELAGADPYSAASVMLWSLGGHAVPVDNRLLKVLKRAEFVDPDATVAEVQAFLERHVQAHEAREFCALTQKLTLARANQLAGAKGVPPTPASRSKPTKNTQAGSSTARPKSQSRR